MNSWKLAAALGLGMLLAGCGGGGADESSDAATDAATEAAATATASEVAAAPSETASAASEAASAAAPAAPQAFAICSACHSATPGENGIGPSLAGVFGTKAAKVAGYEFSDAMKNSGLTWDAKTLDTYLTNPQAMVPGTKMSFGGLNDAAKRKEVIEYLKSIK